MKHLDHAHAALFVLAWVTAFLLGPRALVLTGAVLVAVELVAWRADLLQLPRSRRPGRGLAPGVAAGELPSYDDVRHAVALGRHSGREFDFGLRRRLERVAASRLFERHAVDLHNDPDRAAALLGQEAWQLLDPRRPVSRERGHGGVDRARLARIVERLEAL